MTKSLFISLPVSDLGASTAFYKALGFSLAARTQAQQPGTS